jgi:hypothetical protein
LSIVHEMELNERVKALTKVVIAQAIAIEALTGLPATFEVTQSAEPMAFPNPFRTKSDSAEYQRLCQNFVQARARARSVTSGKLTGHNVGEIIDIDTKHRLAMQRLADFVVGEDKAE